MPPLDRNAGPLLRRVDGKPTTPTTTNDGPNVSSTSPSSPPVFSVPKSVPRLEDVDTDADPLSPAEDVDSDEDGARKQPESPYVPPHRQKGIGAHHMGNGRAFSGNKRSRVPAGNATTRDTAEAEPEDTEMFGWNGTEAKRLKKGPTYARADRTFGTAGAGGRKGASKNGTPKSMQSTPKKGATASGGDKKGTPISAISVNTTPSPERLPGESAGMKKRGLKKLDPIKLPATPPRERPKVKRLDPIELPVPMQKENRPRLKRLWPLDEPRPLQVSLPKRPRLKRLKPLDEPLPLQESSPKRPGVKTLKSLGETCPLQEGSPKRPGLKRLKPLDEPLSLQKASSPKRPGLKTLPYIQLSPFSRDGNTKSKPNNCGIIDLTTTFKETKLNRSKPELHSPATKARKPGLKTLQPSNAATSSRSTSNTPAKRRSSRLVKEEVVDDPKILASASSWAHSPKAGSDADSDLSSPPSSIFLDDEAPAINPAGNYETPALCPICGTPVDRLLLEEWQGSNPYMRINTQIAFCDAHKRASAHEEYEARGYPAIDLDDSASLVARIERFRPELLRVLQREQPSAFRDALEAEAAQGVGRTLRAISKREEGFRGMSVGYYGPRGRRVMEGWVAARLAEEIRQAAGVDRLIGYKTVSGFIQEVLVPEVAMRLVAEDLDVGEARAREVLGESGEIGELVNGVVEGDGEGRGNGVGGRRSSCGAMVADDDENGDY